MLTIIDEKQTGKYRLLILNEEPELEDDVCVLINGKKFKTTYLHGLSKALAIKCDTNEPSLIGFLIKKDVA